MEWKCGAGMPSYGTLSPHVEEIPVWSGSVVQGFGFVMRFGKCWTENLAGLIRCK